MKSDCGCCEGTEKATPVSTANRPGLTALSRRVGTHASFLETMIARLSSADVPELRDLKTRLLSDPSIALLDSWALVADVLTFYQERIANEGYLRTATERRSILEMARLIGYTLQPGVASSVYLAYTLDEDRSQDPPKPTSTTVLKGSRAQSIPGDGETAQSFETSDDLYARSEWNNLQVRLTRPQTEFSIKNASESDPEKLGPRIYLEGISTNLKPNDPLLIVFDENKGEQGRELFRVMDVKVDLDKNWTLIKLQMWTGTSKPLSGSERLEQIVLKHDRVITNLFASTAPTKAAASKILRQVEGLHAGRTDEEVRVSTARWLEEQEKSVTTSRNAKLTEFRKKLIADVSALHDEMVLMVRASTGSFSTSSGGIASSSGSLVGSLNVPPSIPPASSVQLPRQLGNTFSEKNDTLSQLQKSFQPGLAETLPVALANSKVTPESKIKAYALRLKASPFGSNVSKRTRVDLKTGEIIVIGEWPIVEWLFNVREEGSESPSRIAHEQESILFLDSSYDKILPDTKLNPSWIIIDASAWVDVGNDDNLRQVTPASFTLPLIARVKSIQADISRSDYGISPKTTRIQLSSPWLKIIDEDAESDILKNFLNSHTSLNRQGVIQQVYDLDFQALRNITVYTQTEELLLAEEPIESHICGCSNEPCDGESDRIELDSYYDGLESGRWLIVSGERTDVIIQDPDHPDDPTKSVIVMGVAGTELVMLAGVEQGISSMNQLDGMYIEDEESANKPLPDDANHTFISFASPLAYCYKRDTLKIYGNVVKATHGEMRKEVLGSGDGSQTHQQFSLKQQPLTFVSASNPSGIDSTLKVYVNDVEWRGTNTLAILGPKDRGFTTKTDDDDKITIIFGNGEEGTRLPTGIGNVKATYRSGIGKPGDVNAGQISLLQTRPLNVKGVINPIRASGGADKEDRDQARKNAPLAVMALDRLVSTKDYADFSRTFAGIGKARAVRLTDGRRQLVHVTIAGADNIPIEKSSDLYRNLVSALHDFGDPYLPIQVDGRELLALILSANVKVLPEYLWEAVEPNIRKALTGEFGFQKQELGQPVFLSTIIAVIQQVPGVAYVDVDVFSSISEGELGDAQKLKDKFIELSATAEPPPSFVAVYAAQTVAQGGADRMFSTPVDNIYPAQLAFLVPEVPDTLVLNEVTS